MDDKLKYLAGRFDALEALLWLVLKRERQIIMTLDEIQAKVNDNGDVEASAIILLGQLSDLIRAGANDPVKMQAIADKLDTDKEALAQAIINNTPAAA
jgi:hypothetical protein